MGFHPRGARRHGSMWHESFADCVSERVPSCFQVISEFQLSRRPRRADLLLLRRKDRARDDTQGQILRALWPRLGEVTLVEFKSPSRDFRRSDLVRLGSYGAQYDAEYMDQVGHPGNLTLALVTPTCNPALTGEISRMGWRLHELGDGYAEIVGAWYTTFVAFTGQVAEAEQDDFLRIFSRLDVQTIEARHWLESWLTMKESGHDAKDREGYHEMLSKLLRAMPPEEVLRLAGMSPEERLAGLPPEEQLLALSDEVLRGLPDEYVRSLPRRVQSAIRKRLTRSQSLR